MSSIESGYSPDGAAEWKAPRAQEQEEDSGTQRFAREMKVPAELAAHQALARMKEENTAAVKASQRMEIDMVLQTALPQLESRLFETNKMGDPAFTELVDKIVGRLKKKTSRSEGEEKLLGALRSLKEDAGSEDVDAAA